MIALRTVKPRLAFFNTRKLFCFTMKLLNVPAATTHLLSVLPRILSYVVCNNIFRMISSDRYSEQLHFEIPWELLDFNEFAMENILRRPCKLFYAFVWQEPIGVIHKTITLDGAVEYLPESMNL